MHSRSPVIKGMLRREEPAVLKVLRATPSGFIPRLGWPISLVPSRCATIYTRCHVRRGGRCVGRVMLTEHQSGPVASIAPRSAPDHCRHSPSFDTPTVSCPAFQRAPFVAATSYGKPLGTHVACAHFQVGESNPNQFYPRCSLGSDTDRMRWIAMMGPGKIEELRSLNAEFETLYAASLQQLIAAKAVVLADGDESGAARLELARVVRKFVDDFDTFVGSHASRIEEIGVSTGDLTARAARALGDWQRSQRLDLPRSDDESSAWPETREPASGVEVTPGLVITRADDPPGLSLVGSIDEATLASVVSALSELAGGAVTATVDVSAVTFCSIAGLRALTRAVQAGMIRLRGTQPHLQRALAATRLVEDTSGTATTADLEAAS